MDLDQELIEFADLLDDMHRANYQTSEEVASRYAHFLRDDGPIMRALATKLPEVDFTSWWEASTNSYRHATITGAASLTWPATSLERVALQVQFIKRIGTGEINAHEFAVRFTYVSSRLDDNVANRLLKKDGVVTVP